MGGGEGGAFFLGLGLLVVGVGATVFSITHAAPGGTYVVFSGLILGGAVRMVTALVGGFGGNPYRTRRDKKNALPEKPAWYENEPAEYVEKLADVPSGYCWQCGSKLRRGRTICMACGAAQNTTAPARNTTATPGGMSFGPPPKLASKGHPYDIADEPEEVELDDAPRPRNYYPADPDGSYGWGPSYASAADRGSRSNPGYQSGGRGKTPGDARRYVAPPPERDAPPPGRANGAAPRYDGDVPPPPRRRPPGDDVADQFPRRQRPAPPPDDDRARPPRGQRRPPTRWGDDEDMDYRESRRSSPRHEARPRPRPAYDGDEDWDDGDYSSSPRHPSRR